MNIAPLAVESTCDDLLKYFRWPSQVLAFFSSI